MRSILLASCFTFCLPAAFAQQPQTATAKARLHRDTVALIETMGVRAHLIADIDRMIVVSQIDMTTQFPDTDVAFNVEWGKRMRERLDTDQMVRVVEAVYEKHFTDSEVRALTRVRSGAGKLPPALQAKVDATMPVVREEILAGYSAIAAKLGGDIGAEIGAEHPEWIKQQTAHVAALAATQN